MTTATTPAVTDDDLSRTLGTLSALDGAARRFGTTLTAGLKAAAVEGRALDDVLRQMVLRLSASTLDAAMRPLADLLGQLAGSVSGALGGVVSGALAGVVPFARGGVVAAPTYFPLSGGRTGLAGEAGAEAILPLERGADGTLGVRGGAGGRPVTVTMTVTTPDADSFLRSEAQVQAMLARAVSRGRRGL